VRAIVKAKPEPGLWMQDVPAPEPGPNDLLIKVRRASICGTDVHIWNWDEWSQKTVPVGLTIGHEFMGEIVKIGSAVRDDVGNGFQVGQRVCVEGHVTCGHCRNCRAGKRHLCRNTVGIGVQRNGGFAELCAVPAVNAFRLTDQIPDDIASFLDPLGNAVHTALSFDLVGEDVLITGAGRIGGMAAAVAHVVGARFVVVTDVNDHRLEIAKSMGATRVVNVTREKLPAVMKELGMTEGFDVACEMSGNAAAIRDMFDVMNNGGRIGLLGIPTAEIPVDFNKIIFKGLLVKGIYGREMFETWYKMANLLKSGLDVRPVLTHKFPAADFEKAFEVMRTGKSGKVVLDWTA